MMVWCGYKNAYKIPEKFNCLRFTKSGSFDKRMKMGYYKEFCDWLASVGE